MAKKIVIKEAFHRLLRNSHMRCTIILGEHHLSSQDVIRIHSLDGSAVDVKIKSSCIKKFNQVSSDDAHALIGTDCVYELFFMLKIHNRGERFLVDGRLERFHAGQKVTVIHHTYPEVV